MDLAHGPISIAGGVVFGVLGGILVGSTKLWSTPVARTLATLVMSQLLMFCAVRLGSGLSLCLRTRLCTCVLQGGPVCTT